MYYTDDFKILENDNEDDFKFKNDEMCDIYITKENISISDKIKKLAKFDIIKENNGPKIVVESGDEEGFVYNNYYIYGGNNVTYKVAMSYPMLAEYAEGIAVIMHAMIESFEVM